MTQVAVITGGATGIGRAVAERLLDDGWSVAIVDSNEEALAETEDRFSGEDAVFLSADVTDEDEIADVFDTVVEMLGPITALVNAASVRREALFEETGAELFRELLEINLVGSFIAAEAAVERMGDALSIVNLSSVSGIRANAGNMAYGASKAGVKMMTEAMALELASRGVRANCVAPGLVESEDAPFVEGDIRRLAWLERTPQRRTIDPKEVAAAVAYLLVADSVTGHTLIVDGGLSIAGVPRSE